MRAGQPRRGFSLCSCASIRSAARRTIRAQRGLADRSMTNCAWLVLCEKFWNAQPARVKGKILRSHDAWCVPASVVARFLEPLAAAAEKKKSDAAAREGRAVLLAYARCLESEESKARRAVAAGIAEIAPQMERLWPHSSAADFGRGIVQALLKEIRRGSRACFPRWSRNWREPRW